MSFVLPIQTTGLMPAIAAISRNMLKLALTAMRVTRAAAHRLENIIRPVHLLSQAVYRSLSPPVYLVTRQTPRHLAPRRWDPGRRRTQRGALDAAPPGG